MVYNLHHGHDHLDRFPALLAKMHALSAHPLLERHGPGGDRHGRKILPLGQGSLDLELLRAICASGYSGPIGILGHTMDDAEERLQDNLDGLDWLVPQLEGQARRAAAQAAHARARRHRPQDAKPPPARSPAGARLSPLTRPMTQPWSPTARRTLAGTATLTGAEVFASPKFACLSCHRVGDQGGIVGPDLSTTGLCLKPEEVVESLLWPRRQVKEGYRGLHRRHQRRQDPPGLQAGRDSPNDSCSATRPPASDSRSPRPISKRFARMAR